LKEIKATARDVLELLGISNSVNGVFVEEVESPWQERALIKRRKGHLDVKILVWKDEAFLYGRIYRLFLYVYDVLNPQFQYRFKDTPQEESDPAGRDRYNRIWSIYVDSRMERMGIDNFYDKALRRNLFLDGEKTTSWVESAAVFEKLWSKGSYTHPEIVGYARDIDGLKADGGDNEMPIALEVEINRLLSEPHVKSHLQRIRSDRLRDTANHLLNFTAYHCKDTHISPSYYGISITYQHMFFAEIIPSEETLYLTLFDAQSQRSTTFPLNEESDIKIVEQTIRDLYNRIAMHNQ
jgi:hypothetical protein